MKLKFIEPSDIEDVVTIENKSFPEGVRESREDLLKTMKDERHVGILALSDSGKPIGYVIGSPAKNYDYLEHPEKQSDKMIYCQSIAVVDEKRRQRIGTNIYATFLLEAFKNGFEKECEHAYDGIIGFRKKFNPSIIREEKEFYDDGKDALLLENDLKRMISKE